MATDHDITMFRFMPQDDAGSGPSRRRVGGVGRSARHVDNGVGGTVLREQTRDERNGQRVGETETKADKRKRCGTRAYYKEVKKEAKAEFKDIAGDLNKSYERSLEDAQRQYLDNAEWSKEIYENAKREARDRYEKAVQVAKSTYEFTVDIAREQYRDAKADGSD